jgi:hypothetical protein
VIRPDLVVLNLHACIAYGLLPGTTLPAGAWLVTADGTALVVMESGALMPRPCPLPFTRPSVGAIPTMVLR